MIALLLILAAVFCLTACPQPANPDPEPTPAPAPTPTPETPATVTPATFDYTQFTVPENTDSLTWTTIDAAFDFASLANTKWMGVEVDEQPDNGLVEYYAGIYSINEDATDAALTMLQTKILDKRTLDEDEITEAINELILYVFMIPEEGATSDLITDDPTKLIAGIAFDDGNYSDDPFTDEDDNELSFRDAMLIGSQIDSSNTYVRVLMSRPGDPEEYMYMFNVTETPLPDTSTPGYIPEIPPATSLAATIDYSQFIPPVTAEGWTDVTEADLADTTWIQLMNYENYPEDGLLIEEYSAVVLSVNSEVSDASVNMLMTQIVTKEDESSFTPREIAFYYLMMNSMIGTNIPAGAIVEVHADDPTKLIMGVTIDMGNYSDDPFTDGQTHEEISFSDYIHYHQIDSSKTCLRILQSHDTGIYNYYVKL